MFAVRDLVYLKPFDECMENDRFNNATKPFCGHFYVVKSRFMDGGEEWYKLDYTGESNGVRGESPFDDIDFHRFLGMWLESAMDTVDANNAALDEFFDELGGV